MWRGGRCRGGGGPCCVVSNERALVSVSEYCMGPCKPGEIPCVDTGYVTG